LEVLANSKREYSHLEADFIDLKEKMEFQAAER
jgi:hypothetical protein